MTRVVGKAKGKVEGEVKKVRCRNSSPNESIISENTEEMRHGLIVCVQRAQGLKLQLGAKTRDKQKLENVPKHGSHVESCHDTT